MREAADKRAQHIEHLRQELDQLAAATAHARAQATAAEAEAGQGRAKAAAAAAATAATAAVATAAAATRTRAGAFTLHPLHLPTVADIATFGDSACESVHIAPGVNVENKSAIRGLNVERYAPAGRNSAVVVASLRRLRRNGVFGVYHMSGALHSHRPVFVRKPPRRRREGRDGATGKDAAGAREAMPVYSLYYSATEGDAGDRWVVAEGTRPWLTEARTATGAANSDANTNRFMLLAPHTNGVLSALPPATAATKTAGAAGG